MMRTLRNLAPIIALVPLAAPGFAADPAPVHDGQAAVDPPVLALLSNVRQRGSMLLEDADVLRLADLLKVDGVLEANERDLIAEMTRTDFRGIGILQKGGDGRYFIVGSLKDERRAYLRQVMNLHYARLYGEALSEAGWEELVREAGISDGSFEGTRDFLADKALAAAKGSDAANGWQPARALVLDWASKNKAIAAELQEPGRKLIHASFRQADLAAADALPDFLYGWVVQPAAAQ